MKRLLLLLFLVVCLMTCLANEPDQLLIHGPNPVAINSVETPYWLQIMTGRPIRLLDCQWACYNANHEPMSGCLHYGQSMKRILVDVGTNDFYLHATIRYIRYAFGGTNVASVTSDLISVTNPVFSAVSGPGIHNGEYDTASRTYLHLNIDDDNDSATRLEAGEDYLEYPVKRYEDNDLVPFRIDVVGNGISVDANNTVLNFQTPPNVRIWQKISSGYYTNIVASGTNMYLYCGRGQQGGKIFGKDLYVEGVGPGNGTLKVYYVKGEYGDNVLVYSRQYQTCSSSMGRQPYRVRTWEKEFVSLSMTNGLEGCEWSLIDDVDSSYNAASYAVDPYWTAYGCKFMTFASGFGTGTNLQYESFYNSYCSSFDQFGNHDGFVSWDDMLVYFTSPNWYLKLRYDNGRIYDCIVLFYGFNGYDSLKNKEIPWAAHRILGNEHWSGNYFDNKAPAWQMFVLKADEQFKLIHRGEALYQFYLDNCEINDIPPAKFAPVLED